jgi:transposase InsO family protein
LSLWQQGEKVTTLAAQYRIPRSTIYYWIARYKTHRIYHRAKSTSRRITRKVTDSVKAAVLSKHKKYPKLGCWRLSLFEYANQTLSHTTIWRIIVEARTPQLPRQALYVLSRFHQLWFIDHMHLKTLPNGQKVYSLIVLDGLSRVLVSETIVLSKSALDAVITLLAAFAQWGMPETILSDNAKAFRSLLYTLLMATLRIGVRYTTPGCPWENPFAESMISIHRAYFYPHLQMQKSIEGVSHIYAEQTRYYNQRPHWAFRKEDVKTPLARLGSARGRPLPKDFSLSLLAQSIRLRRTVDGQGTISFKRYRLFVHYQLAKQQVEIRENFDSLIIIYRSGAVVSYECIHEENEIQSVQNTPVFHDHQRIQPSLQLELFDLSAYELHYVTQLPPYVRKSYPSVDAIQLTFLDIQHPKRQRKIDG